VGVCVDLAVTHTRYTGRFVPEWERVVIGATVTVPRFHLGVPLFDMSRRG
jgi:hypothetical protein